MAINRRTFIRDMCSGGALLASGLPAWALTSQGLQGGSGLRASTLINLQTGTELDQLFYNGVSRTAAAAGAIPAIRNLHIKTTQLTDPQGLQQLLSALHGTTLIGLMDDVTFTLFHCLARSQGCHFLLSGQHSWGGAAPYQSRHQLVTVPQSQGVGAAIAAGLNSNASSYFVSETSLGAQAQTTQLDRTVLSNSVEWAELAGAILAKIGLGQWQAGTAGIFRRAATNSSGAVHKSLASFIIKPGGYGKAVPLPGVHT